MQRKNRIHIKPEFFLLRTIFVVEGSLVEKFKFFSLY